MEYEQFSVYGLSIEYPAGWRVELPRRLERDNGDVSFRSPEGPSISVFWGPLERLRAKFQTPAEYASDIFDKIKKSRGIKSLEVLEEATMFIGGHEGAFYKTEETISYGIFIRRTEFKQRTIAAHFFCGDSKRYFTIYGTISPQKAEEQEGIIRHMIKSIRCHP
ncbi:MAG: hypothetical protein QXQ76_04625 [Candidatus Bathyarchaeia archaeon]